MNIIDIGSKERFLDFVNSISERDKVALVTHTDLDGLAAGFVSNKVLNAQIVKLLGYDHLNLDLASELESLGATKVVITDLFVKDNQKDFLEKLESFADVMILDHHLSSDWNSDKTVLVKSVPGICAGYLCYKLFSEVKDLEKFDWLVACSCVSDFCHVKTKSWLEKIYEKYGDNFEEVGDYVRTSGKFWDLIQKISFAMIYFRNDLNKVFASVGESFGEVGDLETYAEEVRKEFDRVVEDFEKNKEVKGDICLYMMGELKFSMASIISTTVSQGKNSDKTVLVLRDDGDYYKISARRQDKKKDMNKLLHDLFDGLENASGGGHVASAGGRFMKKDLGEVRRRLGLDE